MKNCLTIRSTKRCDFMLTNYWKKEPCGGEHRSRLHKRATSIFDPSRFSIAFRLRRLPDIELRRIRRSIRSSWAHPPNHHRGLAAWIDAAPRIRAENPSLKDRPDFLRLAKSEPR